MSYLWENKFQSYIDVFLKNNNTTRETKFKLIKDKCELMKEWLHERKEKSDIPDSYREQIIQLHQHLSKTKLSLPTPLTEVKKMHLYLIETECDFMLSNFVNMFLHLETYRSSITKELVWQIDKSLNECIQNYNYYYPLFRAYRLILETNISF